MKHIVFVMGSTCAGKSTLIEQAVKQYGPLVRTCLIGKELRARHPPEYFRGLAAMPETEPEVREIFSNRLTEFMEDDRAGYLLCDGIPRLPTQVEFISRELDRARHAYDQRIDARFIVLHADANEIDRRAHERDCGANLELTLSRIKTDKLLGYDTLISVVKEYDVSAVDTSNGTVTCAVLVG